MIFLIKNNIKMSGVMKSINSKSKSRSNSINSSQGGGENVEGNPWTVVPIKTRLYAKDTTEIELSNRKITHLCFFEQFENLEALWLNNNKLKKIENLDKNFRIKELFVSQNRLITLEGSLLVMKFLKVLLLDNNKLRQLDKQLVYLKQLPFLENLNLFNNPLAEEPEYRYRVIFNIPKLKVFDRHKITEFEKIKAEKVVPEYMNPLSNKKSGINTTVLSNEATKKLEKEIQKQIKKARPIKHSEKILMTISKTGLKPLMYDPNKNKKQYEKMSITEKEMFVEANEIYKERDRLARAAREKELEQLRERELKDFDLPHNREVEKNNTKYYREDSNECPELEINEIRRIFGFYDPSKFFINFL